MLKTIYRALPLPLELRLKILAFRNFGGYKSGKSTFVHKSVQILGKRSFSIGSNSVLSEHCWINVNDRRQDKYSIIIGDNCFIGRRNFFSSGNSIVIGDYTLTANDCYFLGSSHNISDPMQPYLSTGTTSTANIIVGPNTFIGAGAKIIGNVKIGHGSVIGAGAVVVTDVPPFSMLTGFPAVIIKRFSFLSNKWVNNEAYGASDDREMIAEDEYLAALRKCGDIEMPIIASGSNMGNLK